MANHPDLSPCRKLFRPEHRNSKMKTASQDQVSSQVCSWPLPKIVFVLPRLSLPFGARLNLPITCLTRHSDFPSKKHDPDCGLYHPSGWVASYLICSY